MLKAQDYLELVRKRGEEHKELKRVYSNLQRPDLFMLAYGKLYGNKGAMTEGTNPEDTIDGMSLKRINKLIQSLSDGTFRWQPTKRIYIPKANGIMRPLSVPSWSDKLVQEVMRLVLEAYYEPKFNDRSHGFRTNRGCHTALTEIKKTWTGTTWFIEGDIKGCFDNIDHDKLLEIMGGNIKDPRFLKLIRELLKAGYMEDWKYQETYSGTPQGGVLSPLLANIYLNDFDEYVEKGLLTVYTKGDRYTRKTNPSYKRIVRAVTKAKEEKRWEDAEELGKELRTIRTTLPDANYRRLKYIRYADDFLLGYTGTKKEAEAIKEEIGSYLSEVLKLEMSTEKTKVTHAASECARFLGYNITVAWNNGQRTNGQRSINGKIQLRVSKQVRDKWERKYTSNGKAIHLSKLLAETDFDIVSKYESEIRGLTNYYALAINIATLGKIKWLAEQSLVKTLAAKHQQSVRRIYKKYVNVSPEGIKCIEVKVDRAGKEPLIARFGGKPLHYKRFAELDDNIKPFRVASKRTQLEQRLIANECENCGSQENVQVHHIKSIKTVIRKYRKRGTQMPWWINHMAEAYRKTIVVCAECHRKIHAGEYNGRKLS